MRGWWPVVRYAGVLEGGIAVAMLLGTYALFGLSPSVPLLMLAFCGTWLVYLAERALGWAPEDVFAHPDRLVWLRRHRPYVVSAALLAVIGAGWSLPQLRPATLVLGSLLAVVSLLYIAPVLPGRYRLKSVWWLKPLAVAAAWAVGGVLVPAVEGGYRVAGPAVLLVGYRLLFILPNVMVFDWLDRTGDAEAGLRTVATERCRTVRRDVFLCLGVGGLGAVLVALILPVPFWVIGIDALGLGVLAYLLRAPWSRLSPPQQVLLDAVIAWPAVTALAVWIGGS